MMKQSTPPTLARIIVDKSNDEEFSFSFSFSPRKLTVMSGSAIRSKYLPFMPQRTAERVPHNRNCTNRNSQVHVGLFSPIPLLRGKGEGNSKLLHSNAFAVDAIRTDPAVNVATIVADLKAITLPGFDQVDVLVTLDLAQNNITNLNVIRVHGCNGAELAGLNFPRHRIASWAKLHCVPFSEFVDVGCSPSHNIASLRDQSSRAKPGNLARLRVGGRITPNPSPYPLPIRWGEGERKIRGVLTQGSSVQAGHATLATAGLICKTRFGVFEMDEDTKIFGFGEWKGVL
jgi:hypothetical protein